LRKDQTLSKNRISKSTEIDPNALRQEAANAPDFSLVKHPSA